MLYRAVDVQIWDPIKTRRVRTLKGHPNKVGSMAWSFQRLATGSQSGIILEHDLRTRPDWSKQLQGHQSEVCGLCWSHDERELASGGNDNQVVKRIHSSCLILERC